jgi:hypothetical protein
MTYDLLDNEEILVKYGGYDFNRSYSFEELIGVNAWQQRRRRPRTVYTGTTGWAASTN